MKQKLMSVLSKMKSVAQAGMSKAPLPAGIVIGYIGHPVIEMALKVAAATVSAVVHML